MNFDEDQKTERKVLQVNKQNIIRDVPSNKEIVAKPFSLTSGKGEFTMSRTRQPSFS